MSDPTAAAGPRPVRFVLTSDRRTGSNWLADLLAGHPGAIMLGELFDMDHLGEAALRDPQRYLQERLAGPFPPTVRAVGFKLIYDQATPWQAQVDEPVPGAGSGVRLRIREFQRRVAAAGGPQAVAARFGELRRMLEADTTLRVVHLRRRSLLRQYISLRRALAGDAWAQPGPPAPLRLSAADCREAFERTTQQAANAEAAFARHPVHRLWYEDLCADPARVLAAVAGFLGLADRPVRPSVPHGPPAPLRECVENLDALRGAFGGTPWAAQFD